MKNLTDKYSIQAVEKFLESGQERPLVVTDCDDTLWGLLERACEILGIDFEVAQTEFDLEKTALADAEREALIALFADPRLFEDMKFFPGVERILELEEVGAEVKVQSNAYSEVVGESKRRQLLSAIPGLRPEQIEINVISHANAGRKKFSPQTTILMDDSPNVINMSSALINLVPSRLQRVRTEHGQTLMAGKPVLLLPDFEAMQREAYAICVAIQEARGCF